MKWTIVIAVAMLGPMLPAGVAAQDLPVWKIADICAKDSATGYCAAFEGTAYKAVSGSWTFVPEAVRKACLDRVRSAADQSWRLLGECIDGAATQSVDRAAVKTAQTPGEAVPRSKPVEAVPLPPIPLPIASPLADLEAAAAAKLAAEAEAKKRAEAAAAKLAADEEAKRKAEAIPLPPIPLPVASPLADLEAAAATKLAAEAEAKRKAEADAAAKLVAESKRLAALQACQDDVTAAVKSGAVRFASASAVITPDSAPTLDRIAGAIKACLNTRLVVEGHTDASGDAAKNKDLSARRAQAITAALVNSGVEPWRLNGQGFGQEKPVASNDTEEGRALNRRIEMMALAMTDGERQAAIAAEAGRKAERATEQNRKIAAAKACDETIKVIVAAAPFRFRIASATVMPETVTTIERVATALKSCPDANVSIEGHSDAQGNAETNLELSENRAISVLQHLVSGGIDLKRLKAIGHGQAKPVAPNDREEQRARNRRIEFVVTAPAVP